MNRQPNPQGIREQDARLVQIVDAALADATRRAGPHLVCRPGCTQCCHGAFAINALDALRLRSAMADISIQDPARAEAIATRAQHYLLEFAPDFPGNRQTGILGTSEEDQAAFEDFANEAACPALDPATGLCDLYQGRPMTCRVFGPPVRAQNQIASDQSSATEAEGLAVCELCFTQATSDEIAAAEIFVPHFQEAQVLMLLQDSDPEASGDTIIAYCLGDCLSRPPSPPPAAS